MAENAAPDVISECTMVSAIQSKFNQEDLNAFGHIYFSSKSVGKKVGGDIVVPPNLVLDKCNIETTGDQEQIRSLCHHVTELDLTGNKVTDWKEILSVLKLIPNLKFLNLTSNKLDNSSLPVDVDDNCIFTDIKHLILNNTGVSWDIIARLLIMFPSLTELHLSLNSHGDIQLPVELVYPSLTKLHFNGHCIEKFEDLCILGRVFPNLEEFVTVQSELQTIETSEENYKLFQNMKCLNITNSKLKSWDDIDQLRKFVSLTDVRMKSIPFLEELEAKQRRDMVIARLPNIKRLNGSMVQEGEREDAERAFIRHYMDLEEKPDRYFELEAQYGQLDPLAEVDLTAQRFLKLKVKFQDKEEFIDIDIKQTVKEFKKFLQNFVKLPPSKFRLFYLEYLDGRIVDTTELKINRTLLSYNIEKGDEFIVEPRYHELEAVYGKLDPLAEVKMSTNHCKKMKIKLDDKEDIIEIDLRHTLKDLKKSLQNFVKLPPSKFRVFFRDFTDVDVLPFELTLLQKTLRAYHMDNDGEIFILLKGDLRENHWQKYHIVHFGHQ